MNGYYLLIIACLLAAAVIGVLFIATWVKKKTCVTGTDFIMEQGNFLRGLWTTLPESHQLAFWYIWLQHHRMFYDVFGRGHHWHNPELFDEGLTLLTKAIHTGIPVQQFSEFMEKFAENALPLNDDDDFEQLAVFPGTRLYTVMDYFQEPSGKKLADCFLKDSSYDDLIAEANDFEVSLPDYDLQNKMDSLQVEFLKELSTFERLPDDWERRLAHYGKPLLDLHKIKIELENAHINAEIVKTEDSEAKL